MFQLLKCENLLLLLFSIIVNQKSEYAIYTRRQVKMTLWPLRTCDELFSNYYLTFYKLYYTFIISKLCNILCFNVTDLLSMAEKKPAKSLFNTRNISMNEMFITYVERCNWYQNTLASWWCPGTGCTFLSVYPDTAERYRTEEETDVRLSVTQCCFKHGWSYTFKSNDFSS